jgi:hypothetical protein
MPTALGPTALGVRCPRQPTTGITRSIYIIRNKLVECKFCVIYMATFSQSFFQSMA